MARTMDFKERVRRRNEFDASLVYGTKKFNMLTGRDKHVDYRSHNDDHWLDPATGIIRETYSSARPCPLCAAGAHETLFVKSGFPHVKCSSCGLVYVTPILNEAEYAKLWSAEDSWENVLESAPQIKMQTLEARYSLDIAGLYLEGGAPGKRICDVGCGPGTLLQEAKRGGYEVFGIEPNSRCHRFLAEKNIAFAGDFFPLKEPLGKVFDAVFLLNTLEHLRDPAFVVKEIKQTLKPGGLIYVSVPNIDALVNRVMHAGAGVFGGHSHLQFFNGSTLASLLSGAGFEVLEYETIITELGVIKNYLSFQDPYFGDTGEHFDFLTPELIYSNHFARNVNMVARLKKG